MYKLTRMSNCIICSQNLTLQNDSLEHIIPNAVGGFRKVRRLLCQRCNNTTGHDWDAVLASQLNGLCHFFDIKRERGSIPDQIISTTAGESFRMLSSGRFALQQPLVNKTQEGGKIQYQVTARDMREAQRILSDIQKKWPKMDVSAALKKVRVETSYLKGMVKIPCQIGGPHAGRSIVKSVIALLHDSGVPTIMCDQALAYLRDQHAPACLGYYSTTDLIVERPAGVPLHCVAISGNPATGMLLGYVEYFGFLRSVILLSKTYTGPNVENCYAIDPTTGTQLDISVSLHFSQADIVDIFDCKYCNPESLKKAADEVFGPGMARKRQREQANIINEAVQYGFKNCGAQEGEVLTEEHIRRLAQLVAEKMVPFIINLQQPCPLPSICDLSSDMEGK